MKPWEAEIVEIERLIRESGLSIDASLATTCAITTALITLRDTIVEAIGKAHEEGYNECLRDHVAEIGGV
jgi:hypothetical protein